VQGTKEPVVFYGTATWCRKRMAQPKLAIGPEAALPLSLRTHRKVIIAFHFFSSCLRAFRQQCYWSLAREVPSSIT